MVKESLRISINKEIFVCFLMYENFKFWARFENISSYKGREPNFSILNQIFKILFKFICFCPGYLSLLFAKLEAATIQNKMWNKRIFVVVFVIFVFIIFI